MKIKKFSVLVLAFATLSSVFLTGCGDEAPEGDSSRMMQESLYNLIKVNSFRYNISFDAAVSQESVNYDIDLVLNGSMSKVKDNAGEEMNLVAKIGAPDGDYRFDFLMKSIGGFLYVKLLNKPTIPSLSEEVFNDFVDKWWQVEGVGAEDFGLNIPAGDKFTTGYDQMDADSKQAVELIREAQFFKDVTFVENDEVGGVPSYRYKVTIDGNGVQDYVNKIYSVRGEEMTPEDKTKLEEFTTTVNESDYAFDVWVDMKDNLWLKVAGSFKSAAMGYDGDFEVAFSDVNKPFSVKVPVDYEKFDLGQFFRAFMGVEDPSAAGLTDDTVPVTVPAVVPATPDAAVAL